MIPWLKALLYDQATFTQYARFVLFAGGEVLTYMPLGQDGWIAGKALQAIALLLTSSFKPPSSNEPKSS